MDIRITNGLFPYGLNNQLGDDVMIEHIYALVEYKFSALLRISTNVSWGPLHKLNLFPSPDTYFK